MAHKNIFTKQKQTHRHGEQTWLPRVGVGEGWTGSLVLADASCYIENGYHKSPTAVAQGTIFNIL